ncbi:helix-turn-helix domain-containing protein [Kluyvera ascorbata]|uniref:helix-turn-helix domain-containing protein n=1 Tax=Kluyvera ascorbata TaxID=51288 RepID=UPI0039F72B8D
MARARLRQSCYPLRFAHDTVNDIAVRSGFADVSDFSPTFRRQFGLLSNQYR